MTTQEILNTLKDLGNESTRRIFFRHGAREPIYGVKVEDLKKIQRKIKKDHQLSLELYATGISDAQYLAGLIADEQRISPEDLRGWVQGANWYMLSESTVPWVAAESPHGYALALEWIDSPEASVQAAGWSTLASLVSIRPDEELDTDHLLRLLKRVERELPTAANRVRYAMNGYVIALGSYVAELTDPALATGKKLGKVEVDMGGTACKVPFAPDYIQKVIAAGRLGKKRKMARC